MAGWPGAPLRVILVRQRTLEVDSRKGSSRTSSRGDPSTASRRIIREWRIVGAHFPPQRSQPGCSSPTCNHCGCVGSLPFGLGVSSLKLELSCREPKDAHGKREKGARRGRRGTAHDQQVLRCCRAFGRSPPPRPRRPPRCPGGGLHGLDRDLLMDGASKLVEAILITLGQSVAYVVSGMYGSIGDLGLVNAMRIIIIISLSVPPGDPGQGGLHA